MNIKEMFPEIVLHQDIEFDINDNENIKQIVTRNESKMKPGLVFEYKKMLCWCSKNGKSYWRPKNQS